MEEKGTINFQERLRQRIGHPSRVSSVSIRFTKAEAAALTQLAQAQGKTLREWSREILLQEAERSQDDPVFIELIANRMLMLNIFRYLVTGKTMTLARFEELLNAIRAGKRDAAREVMEQYAPPPTPDFGILLLRNTSKWGQFVSEGRRFLCQPQQLPFVVNFTHLSECGLLVWLSFRNQVIEDSSKFVGSGGDCCWSAQPGSQSTKVLSKVGLTAMKRLRRHAQGNREPIFHFTCRNG